jgi:glycosyltransferase involved in cell wall biosynthesis
VSWGALPARVCVYQMPYTRYYRARIAPFFYLAWLAKNRYDWVMPFFGTYGEVTTLRLLPRRTRSCIVLHFPREQVMHQYVALGRYHTAQRANRLVAVSQHVADGVESQFGRPCALIGNGVNTDSFHASPAVRHDTRQKLPLSPDAPMLVTLAALEERKGVQWVIRALPYLLPQFPDLHYWVFGEGAYRASLENEIRSLGLTDRVHLAGNTDDVMSYLNAADVGCLLSSGEAFALTGLEYMAMELPVLSSAHPPFDTLVKAEWGYTVNEQDTQVVAEQLRALLLDPEGRQRMGRAGRQQVLAHHTWSQVADAYLRLLAMP